MTYYRFPENRVTKVLAFAAMFLLLVFCRDTYITHWVVNLEISTAITMGVVCLTGVAFLICNRRNLKAVFTDRRMLLLAAAVLVALVPMLVKRDWQMMYFSILFCICVGVFFSYFATVEQMAKVYVLTLVPIVLYGFLATYVFLPLLELGLYSMPVFTYDCGDYLNYGLCWVAYRNTYHYFRLYTIFREPGVTQFFLILALYMNNYWITWKSRRTYWGLNILFAAAVAATLSTTGMIELMLLIPAVFIDKKLYRDKRVVKLVIAACAAGVLALIAIYLQGGVLWAQVWNIVEKLKNVTTVGSGFARFDSIVENLKLFSQNPLLGTTVQQTMHNPGLIEDNLSSSTILFAIWGIAGGLFHIACWFALVWKKNSTVITSLMILFLLAFSINSQGFVADLFIWLFPVMALSERVLPCLPGKRPEAPVGN